MPLELFEDEFGDVRNARFLAHASDLVYYGIDEAKPKFKDELGLDVEFVQADNTQAYVGTNDGHIVVAFRGTESPTSIEGLKDWLLTNAANLLIIPEGRLGTDFVAAGVGARFHQGFVNAIGGVWDALFPLVESAMKASPRPLWLTGHSLGGALALLAGWRFLRRTVSVHQIYTFGAPMVGNDKAIAAINHKFEGKVFRYVHQPDPIPHLPTMSLLANDFCHCDSEKQLAPIENAETPTTTTFSWASALGQALPGAMTLSMMDDAWSAIKNRIAAHSMTAYLAVMQQAGTK